MISVKYFVHFLLITIPSVLSVQNESDPNDELLFVHVVGWQNTLEKNCLFILRWKKIEYIFEIFASYFDMETAI